MLGIFRKPRGRHRKGMPPQYPLLMPKFYSGYGRPPDWMATEIGLKYHDTEMQETYICDAIGHWSKLLPISWQNPYNMLVMNLNTAY